MEPKLIHGLISAHAVTSILLSEMLDMSMSKETAVQESP
jgi:hypothetical protein